MLFIHSLDSIGQVRPTPVVPGTVSSVSAGVSPTPDYGGEWPPPGAVLPHPKDAILPDDKFLVLGTYPSLFTSFLKKF